MLHIRLLGPLEVADDQGRDLLPPGTREQLCLAVLAVVAPTGLSTPRLAAELYSDRETADPRNAVQAVVSRLRRALGRAAGCVETTSNGYRLVDVHLDIDQAEELLRRATTEPDPTAARALLTEADALWRGPTLDGLGPAAALDAERLRIDGLRADAVDAVATRTLGTGATTPELVAALEAATRAEPLRERRWELLMTALYRQGRQADALRAYQQARRHLSDELGLSPGPALVDLERRILNQDPTLLEAAATLPTPAAPAASGVQSVVVGGSDGAGQRGQAGGPAVFTDPAAALAAALDTARSSGAAIAVHTGVVRAGGSVAELAHRLLDVAHPGQVLASAATVDLARPDLAPGIELRDLGLHWLADGAEPTPVWQVSGPGLRAAFPPLRTSGPASLPRLRSALLGRDQLVAEVVDLVGAHPLVSLVGPGGIGKTSLALAAAWALTGTRPVVFVDLATTADPAAVADRLAQEVAPADLDDNRAPERRLADHLRVSTDLVVVDNAEHVLDAVATVLEPVLAGELKGSLLVTSRQPLGLPGEAIVGIPPLALPATDADLGATGESPSVQLFLARARAARNDAAAVPPGLLPVVAHICRRLDGIPLAIELAAGRASLLSVEDIAARVDDQLRLLRQVRSSRERRHRSLEAVVGWSVDQLTPPARQLFARLAVMAGEFDLAGAEALVERCGLESSVDVLEGLDELHDASLLAVSGAGGAGTARFRMLEPIRQMAEAELTAAGLADETRRAHTRWLIELVADAHTRRDDSRPAAFAAVNRYGSQLRAAVAWIAETAQLDLAEEIALGAAWWFLLNDARAGRDLMTRLMGLADRDQQPLTWAVLVMARAMATVDHTDRVIAGPALEAVEVLDAHGHPDADVARVVAAFTQLAGTDTSVPLRLLQEADTMTAGGGTWSRAVVDMSTMILDGIRYALDPTAVDPAPALARGHRAADALRTMGERWALGVTISELGRFHQQLGHDDQAETFYLEAIELFDGGDHHGTHFLYSCLGRLATGRGDHDRAVAYHRQALAIAEVDANPGCIAISQAGMAHAAEARGDLDEARDRYRLALTLTEDVSILEYGQGEWQAALARLDESATPERRP